MSHLRDSDRTIICDHMDGHEEPNQHDGDEHVHDHEHHGHDHSHSHGEHGHSHGLVDRSILRSREGVKAVGWSLAILGLAAVAQLLIFILTDSVALLADLIHNFGDALTAVPLGIAFYLVASAAKSSPGSSSCSRSSCRPVSRSTRRSSASSTRSSSRTSGCSPPPGDRLHR